MNFHLNPCENFAWAKEKIKGVDFLFKIDWLDYFKAGFSNIDLFEMAKEKADKFLECQKITCLGAIVLEITL